MLKEMRTKNQELKVYLVEGKMYVIISKIAEALGANKSDVYNAAARLGKDNVYKYVKVISLNDLSLSRPTAKCIDVEGIPLLFKRIEKKVDSQKLKDVAEFLNIEYDAIINKDSKSNVVEFVLPTTETIQNENEEKIEVAVLDESIAEKINTLEYQTTTSEEPNKGTEMSLESVETPTSKNVDVTNNSTDNAEDIIDGILNIIEENKSLKEKVASLENAVLSLQEEISKFSGDPLEIEALREENESLKTKLKESESKTEQLINKANLIKSYIESNKQ